ncbi:protein argonaute-3-like [Penaeus japonicus]|uniref:protein argonaute-3-like n=1 Tax=Penaeus japonicus TaxID=27405 RepID=UPI001C70B723|nr:protein argonaute-3-like [Penaeus japonicus]
MPWKPEVLPENPKPPTRSKAKNTLAGTNGRSIRLRANYYPIGVHSWDKTLIHYDVVIEEPHSGEMDIPKRKKLMIFDALKQRYKQFFEEYNLAYDGMKSAVSIGRIPAFSDGRAHEVRVSGDSGRKSRYIVKLKIVNEHNLKTLQVALNKCSQDQCVELPSIIFQMMGIMFRHSPSTRFLCIGQNSFFPLNGELGPSFDIGGGKEVKRGFFGSIRPSGWKDCPLLLNVDVAHAAFYKEQSVLDFIKDTLMLTEADFHDALRRPDRLKLEKLLKGIKIRVTHSHVDRKYRIIGLMEEGAETQEFEEEPGKLTTVKKYFAKAYPRTRLQYPYLNLIRAAPETKTIYLPIECCRISKGQRFTKTLSDNEKSQFIRNTARFPSERLSQCSNIVRMNKFSDDPMMKSLEFTVSDKPVELNGRILPAPDLKMKNTIVQPEKGVWEAWNRQFFQGAHIETWAVFNYDSYAVKMDNIYEFLKALRKMAKERGMIMNDPVKIINGRNPEDDFRAIKRAAENIQMILVNLPSKKGDTYGRIKKIGDREYGVVTQCILTKNLKNPKPATVNNVLLKINGKMGGLNSTLGKEAHALILTNPVMIMGADVNHPPADDRKGTPSLAAVVGSMDRYASSYAVQVRQQFTCKEIINDLQEMTRNLLIAFYRKTGQKPQRLIMYRDGVSESQFYTVLANELRAMRKACESLPGEYRPGITFIVVQKRHHTRLFCDERDGIGRSRNVPPGTIVDRVITHPSEIDFYLCSHQGILGTSKPTHYRVLWDDNDMTMDQLQSMSYALCHTYFRCTRSVSIPTPAYYAHLAAYRAKVHGGACEVTEGLKAGTPQDISKAVQMDQSFAIHNKMYFL